MKILFLDVDGVFTSMKALSWFNYDIYSVNFIRWVCDKTGAKIVISSTWRFNHNPKFFGAIFGEERIHEDWRTPYLKRKMSQHIDRGEEIKDWLNRHPEVTQYLILDDDADMLPEQKSSFIQTDMHNGILYEHMQAIREYFKIEEWIKELKPLHQCEQMFANYNLKGTEKP